MTRNANGRAKVFVVDALRGDYDTLAATLAGRDVELVCFGSGRDALRSNPESTVSMWLINTQLPDMCGTELHDMLRDRGCRAPIALVGDEYHIEDEQRARSVGANLFLAKPLHEEMFLEAA